MKTRYDQVVEFLESLQIMPKTMPGLQKIQKALQQTNWFSASDPEKVIVVAGTNGKGSTCAMLEALLLHAHQKVGFYSSPHLVSTNERIRLNGESISESDFIQLFEKCEEIIRSCELSHFEALTFMAGHYYFSEDWNHNLDYVILEVGLGGTYDATNAFAHRYSVITPIDFDHTNILGKTLAEIAPNKWGIVQKDNTVVYQPVAEEISAMVHQILALTNSKGIEVEAAVIDIQKHENDPNYILKSKWGETFLSMKGARAGQNAMTALTSFAALGFDPSLHLKALNTVNWRGRMQKIDWPGMACPVYLSGDHNPHGIQSLIEILKDYSWSTLHVMVGIGYDKDADEMLSGLTKLSNAKLYLTETPFKGLRTSQYPIQFINLATLKNENPILLLQAIADQAGATDLVIVTGSLYLVGEILKMRPDSVE